MVPALILLLNVSVTGLQFADFWPGTPSKRSIVASSAELRLALNDEVGGMGIWASRGGEAPVNIRAERDRCVVALVRFAIATSPV